MGTTNGFDLLADILANLRQKPGNNALVIDGQFYTYGDLGSAAAGVYRQIAGLKESNVGILAGNNLETYASILAVLFSGKTYVVLHPSYPENRNRRIAELAELRTVICADGSDGGFLREMGLNPIAPDTKSGLTADTIEYTACGRDNAYIIFTSGSTGEPKGVPISRDNLNAFYEAYRHIGWELTENDRMLQMFELTFDVSVVSTLYPLAIGASIYTVGYKDVKYVKVFELLEEYELTFAAVAPSVLQLISPYFEEIDLPALKYLVVTAEASQAELLERFRRCIPNAEIYNLYGPTESTIYCTYYRVPRASEGVTKQHNGMVAIGRPFYGSQALIADDEGRRLPDGTPGEMWISGPQVMEGYFNAPDKSAQAMVKTPEGVFYKTGDLCIVDPDGEIIYCGRKDYQVKIQGFRIELSEIEYTAKQFFTEAPNIVVIPVVSAGICSELHMAVEVASCDEEALRAFLASKLPHYMLPKRIHCIAQFPTSASNKIDRKQIATSINSLS